MKKNDTTTGVYYEIIGSIDIQVTISSDRAENFVFISKDGVWDSRYTNYWIDVCLYNNDMKTIEHYCFIYDCTVKEVSIKTVILAGVEPCYADRT